MKAKKRKFFSLLLLGWLLCAAAVLGQTPHRTAAAQKADATESERASVRQVAVDWLSALEQKGPAAGYKSLSNVASGKVDQSAWSAAIGKAREQFGEPTGRTLGKMRLHAASETADGKVFYLVQYDSVSLKRGALEETLRVVKDDDGQWRVAGYSIEPKHQGGDEGDDDEK